MKHRSSLGTSIQVTLKKSQSQGRKFTLSSLRPGTAKDGWVSHVQVMHVGMLVGLYVEYCTSIYGIDGAPRQEA